MCGRESSSSSSSSLSDESTATASSISLAYLLLWGNHRFWTCAPLKMNVGGTQLPSVDAHSITVTMRISSDCDL